MLEVNRYSAPRAVKTQVALRTIAIISFYVIVAIVMTYPLITQLGKNITGYGGDSYIFLWNYWWFKKALLAHLDPFFTDYIFYPLGVNLTMHTYNLFNTIIVSAVGIFHSNIILTHNLLILLSLVIAAYGAYQLVYYETRDRWAAVIGGLIFGFSPAALIRLQGHFNLTSIQFIPFYTLYFLKTLRDPGTNYRNPVIAGIFLVLTGLCDMYYLVFLFLFSLFTIFIFIKKPYLYVGSKVSHLAILVLTFLLGFAPIIYESVKLIAAGQYVFKGWGGANANSADLLGFIVPSQLHPVFGKFVGAVYAKFTGGAMEGTTFLGFITIALSIYAIAKLRRSQPNIAYWAKMSIIFLVLSLGPTLHVLGHYMFQFRGIKIAVPLPYIILHFVPILQNVRIPNRFTIMIILSLAVLVGYAIAELLKNKTFGKRQLIGSVFSVLIIFEFLTAPYPSFVPHVPDYYYELAKQKGDFTILDIPLGWRDGLTMVGYTVPETQYYQTVHGKRILSGYIARVPDKTKEYYLKFPIIKQLVDLQENPAKKPTYYPSAFEAQRFVREFNIKVLVIPKPYINTPVEAYIKQAFHLQKVYTDEELSAYTID